MNSSSVYSRLSRLSDIMGDEGTERRGSGGGEDFPEGACIWGRECDRLRSVRTGDNCTKIIGQQQQ